MSDPAEQSDSRKILPCELIVLIEIDPEQLQAAEKLILHNFPGAKLTTHQDLQGDDRIVEVHV